MSFQESVIAFWTLLYSEIQRCFRIWVQTLLPSVITMVLYFVIFGGLVGSQIKNIQHFSYMQYITPGLVMMAIITNAYTETVGLVYIFRFQKCIDELVVSPMSNFVILASFTIGGMLRGLVVGILVILVSLFFTHLELQHGFILILTAVMSSIVFASLGLLNALYAKNFDDISIVPQFILTPLTYFGGVFYSVQMLPHFWEKLSYFNPILYIINAFRYGLLGISDVPVYPGLGIIAVCMVIIFIINLRLLNKGVGIRT